MRLVAESYGVEVLPSQWKDAAYSGQSPGPATEGESWGETYGATKRARRAQHDTVTATGVAPHGRYSYS